MKYFKFILFFFFIFSTEALALPKNYNVLILNSSSPSIFNKQILESLELSLQEHNISITYYEVNDPENKNEIDAIESLIKKNRSVALISFNPISNSLLDNFSKDYLENCNVYMFAPSSRGFKTKHFKKNFQVELLDFNLSKKLDFVIKKHSPKQVNFLIDSAFKNSYFYETLLNYRDSKPNTRFNFINSDIHTNVTALLSKEDSLNIIFSPLLTYSNDGAFKSKLSPFGTMSKIATVTDNPSYGGFKEFGTRFNIGAFNYSGTYLGHTLAYDIISSLGIAENKFNFTDSSTSYDFYINETLNKNHLFTESSEYSFKTYNFDKDVPLFSQKKNKILYRVNLIIFLVLTVVILRYFILKKIYKERIEATNMKNNFIANISHELRTPLNIIISTISLFELYSKNGEIVFKSDASLKKFGYLKKNSFRLLKLINNIIDSSKIDAGFLSLDLEYLNIVEVIEEITLSAIAFAEKKDITLVFDTTFEEIYTRFDRDRLERVILNLLSNALKFTPSNGRIDVFIDKKNLNTLLINVKDSGIGIPLEDQHRIFNRYIQTSGHSLNKSQGSGIGLFLCKSIIEEHKGRIKVSSLLGSGTTFTIELPIIKSNSHIDSKSNSRISELAEIEFSDQ